MSTRKNDVSKRRSLRSLPPVYAPCLVFPHGNKYRDQTFCVPADRSYHVRSVPEMRQMMCFASCYGWLILQNRFSAECCLFDPVTLTKILLPPLADVSPTTAVLTAPPSDPSCVIMFYKQKKNSCCFCKIGDRNWIEQKVECKINTWRTPFGYAVSSKGKIYLFCWKGTFVIDVQDTFAIIRSCEIMRYGSSVPYETETHNYYLKARGDIFQVVVIYLGVTSLARNIVVHKLDIPSMAWVKVESLGDMIFLLGVSSVSVSAAEFGAKGNCVYFVANQRTNLCCFDMEDGAITVTQPCPTKLPHWGEPFWVVPNSKLQLQVKNDVANAKCEVKKEQETWKDLPTDLLQLILQSLYLGDCIRFRLTCKAWLSMTPPIRSLHLQDQSESQPLPWLISFRNNRNGLCHFYHPIYNDVYTLHLPRLAGATVRYAKFGWLLMSEEGIEDILFFFNPMTTETIKLPDPDLKPFLNIAFSSPPTSPDCVVFGHLLSMDGNVGMVAYRKEKDDWSSYILTVSYTFVAANSNPVSYNGVFYSLSRDGKLGIFNPKESEQEDMWKVYTNLSVLTLGPINTRSFIVECDGELLSVFVGHMGSPVHVYKLDRSNRSMQWIEVKSLGDKVMFLSHGSSVLVATDLKGTEDRIYFPRLKENANVFYSLKSGNYHSFGEESHAEWMDTSEHWNCSWF
ncbi:hypothetical protein ACHQM5_011436 [Ranunculus cassubicifolius]